MSSDLIATILLIAGAYLLGALPIAYYVGRAAKGIDIRKYGSGNVGTSNVSTHVGRRWIVPLIAFDILVKGMLPVVIASRHFLDLGIGVEVGAGTASIVGHNWSVWIKFSGGRGMATVLGVIAALHYPLVLFYGGQAGMAWLGAKARKRPLYGIVGLAALAVLAYVLYTAGDQPLWVVLLGGLFMLGLLIFYTVVTNVPRIQARANDSALWWGLAALLLPVWSVVLGQPWQVTAFCGVFLAITATKRLRSNRGSGTGAGARVPFLRLAMNRLVFDRDIDERQAWVRRSPVGANVSASTSAPVAPDAGSMSSRP